MQLDIDIEPTLRFPHMTSIDKQRTPVGAGIYDYLPILNFCHRQTDRQTESDAYEPTVQLAQVGSKSNASHTSSSKIAKVVKIVLPQTQVVK